MLQSVGEEVAVHVKKAKTLEKMLNNAILESVKKYPIIIFSIVYNIEKCLHQKQTNFLSPCEPCEINLHMQEKRRHLLTKILTQILKLLKLKLVYTVDSYYN